MSDERTVTPYASDPITDKLTVLSTNHLGGDINFSFSRSWRIMLEPLINVGAIIGHLLNCCKSKRNTEYDWHVRQALKYIMLAKKSHTIELQVPFIEAARDHLSYAVKRK